MIECYDPFYKEHKEEEQQKMWATIIAAPVIFLTVPIVYIGTFVWEFIKDRILGM